MFRWLIDITLLVSLEVQPSFLVTYLGLVNPKFMFHGWLHVLSCVKRVNNLDNFNNIMGNNSNSSLCIGKMSRAEWLDLHSG